MVDSEFKLNIDNNIFKSLKALEQFEVFFTQLKENPVIKSTIKSEVSRLNDLKNCDYHRQKITQFLGDYNKCVEENLKLKESNVKLGLAK